jgi:hypothetical protein
MKINALKIVSLLAKYLDFMSISLTKKIIKRNIFYRFNNDEICSTYEKLHLFIKVE